MEANLSVCVCCMKDVLKGWNWRKDSDGYVCQCPKGFSTGNHISMLVVPDKCPYLKEHEAAIKAENKIKEKKYGSRLSTKV